MIKTKPAVLMRWPIDGEKCPVGATMASDSEKSVTSRRLMNTSPNGPAVSLAIAGVGLSFTLQPGEKTTLTLYVLPVNGKLYLL